MKSLGSHGDCFCCRILANNFIPAKELGRVLEFSANQFFGLLSPQHAIVVVGTSRWTTQVPHNSLGIVCAGTDFASPTNRINRKRILFMWSSSSIVTQHT